MVDALASGAGVRKDVRVRLPHPVRDDETRRCVTEHTGTNLTEPTR